MIGLTITTSPLVPDGTLVWTAAGRVIHVQTREHLDWWAQFGLRAEAPEGATGVTVSENDYAAITASIPASPRHDAGQVPEASS